MLFYLRRCSSVTCTPCLIVIVHFDMQLTLLSCDNMMLQSWCCTVHSPSFILPSWACILIHKAPFTITHSALFPNALFQITIVSEGTCVLQRAPLSYPRLGAEHTQTPIPKQKLNRIRSIIKQDKKTRRINLNLAAANRFASVNLKLGGGGREACVRMSQNGW